MDIIDTALTNQNILGWQQIMYKVAIVKLRFRANGNLEELYSHNILYEYTITIPGRRLVLAQEKLHGNNNPSFSRVRLYVQERPHHTGLASSEGLCTQYSSRISSYCWLKTTRPQLSK